MFWHALAPVFLISMLVALGSYFGSIQWFGMQVILSWQLTSRELGGGYGSHLVYFPTPIFVAMLAIAVATLTATSRYLLGRFW